MPVSYQPLEAYRRDLARLGGRQTFGPDDGQWVAAAMLLERFADETAEGRHVLAGDLARFLAIEDATTFATAAIRLANQMERAGALNLAASWLAILERAVAGRGALDVGRAKAQRASVVRKLGTPDAARKLYAEVEVLGRTAGEPELTARAWIGYGVLAQMRGNYPESRRWYRAAAFVAEDNGYAEQTFIARQGLMVAAAKAGDVDGAIREGWNAFLASANDRDREAEALTNMAQLMHESGCHDIALRGFAAAVMRSSLPNLLLAALGGAATAAAMLGRRDIVEAADERIASLSTTTWDYPRASALVDLADAYDTLGDTEKSNERRARALEIASANGFHEFAIRASTPRSRPPIARPPHRLSTDAARVMSDLETLEAAADLIGID